MTSSFIQRCVHFVLGLAVLAAGVWLGILWWHGNHALYWIVAAPTAFLVLMIHLYERCQSRKVARATVESDIRSGE